MPAHRPVLEQHHPIWNFCIDQRHRTNDAAGPACAIDNHISFRVRRYFKHPVHQLGAGYINCSRNAHRVVFVHWAAVEYNQVFLFPQPVVQFFSQNFWRLALLKQVFTERLAGNVQS